MKTKPSSIEIGRLPKDYSALCRILTPRPIHDKGQFEKVTEITAAMAGHKLTPDQADYFDLLCRLTEDYEDGRVALPKVTALKALHHLLETHDMNASDLARLLGVQRTLGALIVRGKRNLTLKHVRTLVRHFSLSADVFL